MNREWAIPLTVGLLAALALAAVPMHEPAHAAEPPATTATPTATASASSTSAPPRLPIVLPFASGNGTPGQRLTFTILTPLGEQAARDRLKAEGHAAVADDIAWQTDALAFYTTDAPSCANATSQASSGCGDPPWAFGSWSLPTTGAPAKDDGRRLGQDRYNGTRLTAHVFDDRGTLVASTDPAEKTWSFAYGSRPSQLPGGVWYVGGNQTAPNGTRPVPSLARPMMDQLRPLMQGLPVGGVASVRSDAYSGLYGTLYVTVRIDDLMQVPVGS